MPIYEFRCMQCGHIQELLQTSSSEELDMKCEECQAETFERVMSTVSYSMGSSGSSGRESCPSSTTRTCGPGKSCTTLQLPGHTR